MGKDIVIVTLSLKQVGDESSRDCYECDGPGKGDAADGHRKSELELKARRIPIS